MGMTFGQLVATACAILSETTSIAVGGAIDALKTVFDDNDKASVNFMEVFREDPYGPVAEAITGSTFLPTKGKASKATKDMWIEFRASQAVIESLSASAKRRKA